MLYSRRILNNVIPRCSSLGVIDHCADRVPAVTLADTPTSALPSPPLTNSLELIFSSTAPLDCSSCHSHLNLHLSASIAAERSAFSGIACLALCGHEEGGVHTGPAEGIEAAKGGKIDFVDAVARHPCLPHPPVLIPVPTSGLIPLELVPSNQRTWLSSPSGCARRLARGGSIALPAPRLRPKKLPVLAQYQLQYLTQRGRLLSS